MTINYREDLGEAIAKMLATLESAEAELSGRIECLRGMQQRLGDGASIAQLNTLYGVSDVATLINTASLWEGRVSDRLELAYEAEQAATGELVSYLADGC